MKIMQRALAGGVGFGLGMQCLLYLVARIGWEGFGLSLLPHCGRKLCNAYCVVEEGYWLGMQCLLDIVENYETRTVSGGGRLRAWMQCLLDIVENYETRTVSGRKTSE